MPSSHFQSVKSLSKEPGRKRFTFKNFHQRVEEIEVDVYRNLHVLNDLPPEGSSFFRESLLYWRELHTAEDFISFYEEMMPWLQTLPQVCLHKESIIEKLLSRLQMRAQLSLEPILRLLAALSRDLLEDFLPFLKRVVNSLVDLLRNGGDKEPEVIELVFTSLSYIMLYLQKYLTRDISYVLKVTVRLRYYRKVYVQEFAAQALSFLLRNAPNEELVKGVRKAICEVVRRPFSSRKYSVSSLLWHTMRGTSLKFHSRARKVLQMIMSKDIMHYDGDVSQGRNTIIEVVTTTLHRIWKNFPAEEIELVLGSLYEQTYACVTDNDLIHLCSLSSILVYVMKVNGRKIHDYSRILELLDVLIQISVGSAYLEVIHCSKLVDVTLQLMLCILDAPSFCDHSPPPSSGFLSLSQISEKWAPIFALRNECLLSFMEGLLLKDPSFCSAFRGHIICVMNDLIEISPEKVLCLMMKYFDILEGKDVNICSFDGVLKEKFSNICKFFQDALFQWVEKLNYLVVGAAQSDKLIHLSDLAVLWGVLCNYHRVFGLHADASLIAQIISGFDALLETVQCSIAGLEALTWQSLVGAALACYHKLLLLGEAENAEVSYFMSHAKSYKYSQHVLFATAEYLDSVHGCPCEINGGCTSYMELDAGIPGDVVNTFSMNLSVPDKKIRLSTLRILSHYNPVVWKHELTSNSNVVEKKVKTDDLLLNHRESTCINVIQLLLSIEATPLSVFTCRKIEIYISNIERGLTAATVPRSCILVLFYGIIGILYNRFNRLRDSAMMCLTSLLEKYADIVWDKFIHYFEECQSEFIATNGHPKRLDPESPDLVKHFKSFIACECDRTPSSTILILLLKSLQRERILLFVESKSDQVIPMFFKFMGCSGREAKGSVGTFHWSVCQGEEGKGVLKEWLNLLKLMQSPWSLFCSDALKDTLINKLLDDLDSDIQWRVLDCLLTWKDDFLIPYEQNLKNLVIPNKLREELATWRLSRESFHIQERHRGHLIPLILRVLVPKVRNLKALAPLRHNGVHQRRAIVRFLAELDVDELPLFFYLIFRTLLPNSEDCNHWTCNTCESFGQQFQASKIFTDFTPEWVNSLPLGQKLGFLHVTEEILSTFNGILIRPFLTTLMGFVVRLLEASALNLIGVKCSESSGGADICCFMGHASGLTHATANTSFVMAANGKQEIKQIKELRSLCLKIIALVLNKYESHDFGCFFWDSFFISVKPLIRNFKQKGFSGHKPSSLFSCFLAMSRSSVLVSLLDREESLVPTVFSILTLRTVPSALLSSVFSFIENLLILDEDLEKHGVHLVKTVLLQHIDALILGLDGLYMHQKETHRKIIFPGCRELKIFKLLSKYIKEQTTALNFIDIISLSLASRGLKSDEYVESLHVIEGLLPVLDVGAVNKIMCVVRPFIISGGADVRRAVCKVFDCLAAKAPSLAFLTNLIHNLNAFCTEEMGELDYDCRLSAYEEISPALFFKLGEDSALIILSHCVCDMSSEELILRQSASKSLLSFVDFSASVLECNVSCHQFSPDVENKTLVGDLQWTRPQILHIVDKFFLRNMGFAMSKATHGKKEWMALLREMVLRLVKVPFLSSFQPLCSSDAEVDFFNNILHLQKHRRAKALSRFRSVITTGNLSEKVMMKIFVPFLFNMLLEAKEGEHIRDACLDSLGAVSSVMQWKSYHFLLVRCFREMALKPGKQKVLLRLVCSILDKFHFQVVHLHGADDVGNKTVCDSSSLDSSFGICTVLEKSVLPELLKFLASNSGSINVNASLAALKLLKLLPANILEQHITNIIHRISNFLKNRLSNVRDEARFALGACFMELGPAYLHFIVEVLKSTLKRGYELHVLGYTLHFLLTKPPSDWLHGKLDYCLDELLLVVVSDILGDVSAEKEVKKIASKMKETRRIKSFDSLKLIAESITFKTSAPKLLSSIKLFLEKPLTQKVNSKLEAMLHHIALGIDGNKSVVLTDLFVFIYGIIEDGIAAEAFMSSDLLQVFAIGILNKSLKKMKFDKRDKEMLSLLDPFVNLLVKCLKSRYEGILSRSFSCLTRLVMLPLPSLEEQSNVMVEFLLDVALRSGNIASPSMHSCIKLFTALFQGDKIVITSSELKSLIQVLFGDLESHCSLALLSLLNAIVHKKVVLSEIYDLAKRVGDLMVSSQLESVRKKCSKILLQFLLNYPLHEKRLQQHLDFLLENLSYVHPFGRESVLEMIGTILVKFPPEVLNSHADKFYLKLVVCLANENNDNVNSMVGAAIKLLIEHVSPQACHLIVDASLTWYTSEKPKSWSIGAQVLGLLVEVLGDRCLGFISEIVFVAQEILSSDACFAENNDLRACKDAKIPLWRESYYTLVLMTKILKKFQNLCFETNFEVIWDLTCKFLLHPHTWLQDISGRMVALYFEQLSDVSGPKHGSPKPETLFLMEPSRLFSVAVSHICQLRGQWSNAATTARIAQNLSYAICGIYSFTAHKNDLTIQKWWSGLTLAERQRYFVAFESLGTRKEKEAFYLSVSGDKSCEGSSRSLQSLLMVPLLKMMGVLAFKVEDIQVKAIFDSFRIISLGIGLEGCYRYKIQLLEPLYKVCEGFTGRIISDEIKQLAEDVRDCIRDILSLETFVISYNWIRKNLKRKRNERKQELKRLSVMNPVKHAKRKLRVADKHRTHKRRKIMKMRERR